MYKSYLATVDPVGTQSADVNTTNDSVIMATKSLSEVNYVPILPDYLQLPDHYNMKDLLFYIVIAVVSSQVMYQVCALYVQSILCVCIFFELQIFHIPYSDYICL